MGWDIEKIKEGTMISVNQRLKSIESNIKMLQNTPERENVLTTLHSSTPREIDGFLHGVLASNIKELENSILYYNEYEEIHVQIESRKH